MVAVYFPQNADLQPCLPCTQKSEALNCPPAQPSTLLPGWECGNHFSPQHQDLPGQFSCPGGCRGLEDGRDREGIPAPTQFGHSTPIAQKRVLGSSQNHSYTLQQPPSALGSPSPFPTCQWLREGQIGWSLVLSRSWKTAQRRHRLEQVGCMPFSSQEG